MADQGSFGDSVSLAASFEERSKEQLIDTVAMACRVLGKSNMTKEPSGHVSCRSSDSGFVVRGRGRDEVGLSFTSSEQIVECDFSGNSQSALGLAAPIEVFIHSSIYRARSDVRSVVHVHPANLVALTICDIPLEPIYGAYDPTSARLAAKGIPTFRSSCLIGTDELGDELAEVLDDASAVLLRGHGLVTVGNTVEEATVNAVRVSQLADMTFKVKLLGGGSTISDGEISELLSPAVRSGDSRSYQSVWRYLCNSSGETLPRFPSKVITSE
ncbi:MAG: class II aldolase/adducin family protein [Actinomycetota bacterium]|nr:MAG: class II aldolase/adducin family protein [Actinomycetota bacterium]